MAGYSNTTIMGRCTREPEVKNTNSGKMVVKVGVAVDRRAGNGTDFYTVTAWEKRGEFLSKYFHKGQMIHVSGEMQSSKNPNTGVLYWELNADRIDFCGSKADSTTTNTSSGLQDIGNDDGKLPWDEDNDLPL